MEPRIYVQCLKIVSPNPVSYFLKCVHYLNETSEGTSRDFLLNSAGAERAPKVVRARINRNPDDETLYICHFVEREASIAPWRALTVHVKTVR